MGYVVKWDWAQEISKLNGDMVATARMLLDKVEELSKHYGVSEDQFRLRQGVVLCPETDSIKMETFIDAHIPYEKVKQEISK